MLPEVENWRPVVGFEGSYEVSDLGRVRSLDRIQVRARQGRRDTFHLRGKILYLGRAKTGHRYVKLGDKGPTKWVHLLVAEAFIGPRPPGLETRHLDGDAGNNRPANLRYGTRSENMYDRAKHGRFTHSPDLVRQIKALKRPERGAAGRVAAQIGIPRRTVAAIWAGDSRREG